MEVTFVFRGRSAEKSFSVVFFPRRAVEVEIDQFKETPLDAGANISKNQAAIILAVLVEYVPGPPDDLPPLGSTSIMLKLLHDLFKQAKVKYSHLIAGLRNYLF